MFRILLVIVLVTYALKPFVEENVKVFDAADVTRDIKVLKTTKPYVNKCI